MKRTPPRALRRFAAGILLAAGSLHCAEPTGPDASVPARVEVEGAGQLGVADGDLAELLVLRVLDARERPVGAVAVTWQVTEGGGVVTALAERTAGDGTVRARWRLGTASRLQRTEARVAGLAPVAIDATARGRTATIVLSAPADSLLVGTSLAVAARVVDEFGDEVADPALRWESSDAAAIEVGASGLATARAEGQAEVRAHLDERTGRLPLRAVDVAASIEIDAPANATVDVEETLALGARVTGLAGAVLVRDVQWRCTGPDVIASCGPLLKPKLVSLPEPATVQVIASTGSLADTVTVRVEERAIVGLNISAPPMPLEAFSLASAALVVVPATVGDTTRLYVLASGEDGRARPNRPLDVRLASPGIANALMGGLLGERRVVNVVGASVGTSVLTIRANGAAAAVTIDVRARAASACPEAGSLSLDLAVGEARIFAPGDAARPTCLDFRQARDAGRVYMLLSDALPRLTGQSPQYAAEILDLEGQGLFYQPNAPVPASYPVVRVHALGDAGAPLAVAGPTRMNAAAATRGGRLDVPFAPSIAAQARTARSPSAAAATAGAFAQAAAASTELAVGDTLYVNGVGYSPELTVAAGAVGGEKFVVRHIGDRLVIAEQADLLAGRLRYADGSLAPPIPAPALAQLEAEYAVAGAQLDRLFPGTPRPTTVATGWFETREIGARELVLHLPLRPGFLGMAGPSFVLMDYWAQPGASEPPDARDVADGILAHEFAHLRHASSAWEPGAPLPPWLVEGIAVFAQELTASARASGSVDPSRTGRVASRPANGPRSFPSLTAGSASSFFRGYELSAYVFDYLADHVAARGGDWRAAVLDLVRNAHDPARADAAVAAHLNGSTVLDLVLRARIALSLERLRIPSCRDCIAPAPELPDWTRFLQYDLPAITFFAHPDAALWPVLRPGRGGATAFMLRTGTMWPVFIDGRDAAADASYLIDLAAAPQAAFSVVRIR
jgi:hypothetical protein